MQTHQPPEMPPNTKPGSRTLESIIKKMDWLENRDVPKFLSPSLCKANDIVLLPLDLEAKHHDTGNSSTTPLLFDPLPDEAMFTYPIDPGPYNKVDTNGGSCFSIHDYNSIKNDPCKSYPPFRLRELAIKLERWIHLAPRTHRYSAQDCTMTHIGLWFPSYLLDQFYGRISSIYDKLEDYLYTVTRIYEYMDPGLPYITMITQHWCQEVCPEDTLMRFELLGMLHTMRTRLENNEEDSEGMVPVLMIAFMIPSHGRILQAHMHNGKLVVAHSRIYSFETMREAPMDLFTRWLLSRPLGLRKVIDTDEE
ncbi:hypothetical protein ASPBRDRAFT_56633 [Aspergillus brasiliensis CBS 101740]|uniref:Uncharacterized protein n=1 Tax=Aspergillus brasiliensis (strain CBS 101740 / IMI 381727 / IBT 21946) TaxID=767769 RepID=A0A1L9UDX7_ASPBC|nr:hypothetical protein ASPBRDRAFT_56633 [Aspergillus brasiliensis CBS 101740]